MKLRRTIPAVLAGVVIAAFSSGAYAGQKYTLGLSTDVTTGTNGPVATSSGDTYTGSYGSYPSLDFTAHGRHSTFATSYSFGYNRDFAGDSGESRSHAASLQFSSPIGRKWNINLSDSFEQTANSTTFQLLRGDTSVPRDFQYIFDPVFGDSRRTNTANLGLSARITERSSLTFGGSYSLLTYLGGAQSSGQLSNQQRSSVNAGYTHALAKGGWSLSFSGSQFDFDAFQKARSEMISLGYSRSLSKNVSLQVSGGPSYLQTPEAVKHHVGSNASAGLTRAIKKGSLSVTYSQSSADSSGFGSISSNQQIAFGMSHGLGRNMTLSADVSGFDTQEKLAGSTSNRGGSVGGSMGYLIRRKLSMNWGGQYQKYSGTSQFAFDQTRVFVSLRFQNPEFWRF